MRIPIPFSASDAWITNLLKDSVELDLPPLEFDADATGFDLLLALYCHESLRNEGAFLRSLHRVQRTGSLLAAAGGTWRPCGELSGFMRCAREVTKLPLALRNGRVHVNTGSAMSTTYVPPSHQRAYAATGVLLQSSHRVFAKAERVAQKVGIALATYFAFLTIHPFRDGNGRTARFYYAAHLAVIQRYALLLLLALPMLHRNRSEAFQLAAKIARMGDMDALLDEFRRSIRMTMDMFGQDLLSISTLLRLEKGQDLSAETTSLLLAIRARVSAYVLG